MKARNLKKKKLIAHYKSRRDSIKAKLADPEISDQDFRQYQRKLDKLPKNSCPIKDKNICQVTGRPHAYIGEFGISRITFRELALDGKLAGVKKSSW